MVAATAAAVAIVTSPAHAATNWISTTGGVWQNADDWSGGVPTSAVDTFFALPDTYTTTLSANATTRNLTLSAGNVTLMPGPYSLTAAGLVTVSGGTLTFAGTAVAGTPAGAGAIGGTGIAVSGGTLNVAALDASAGTLAFTGGAINVSGGVFKPKLTAAVIQTGPSATESYASALIINGVAGAAARPTLGLAGGATAATTYVSSFNDAGIFVGLSGGKGAATVSGTGSTLSTLPNAGGLFVGAGGKTVSSVFYAGDGTLALTAGGQSISYGNATIGYAGGVGRVTVDGANARLSSSSAGLYVGYYRNSAATGPAGNGGLALTNGGTASGKFSLLIGYLGGTGSVTVDGVGSKLSSEAGGLYVGTYRYAAGANLQSDGTLALSAGGQAASVSTTQIGGQGGVGRVSVDGNGSRLATTAGDLYVGYNRDSSGTGAQGDGTLTLTAGGLASTYTATYIGNTGGVGRVTVDGVGTGVSGTASTYDAALGLFVGASNYGAIGSTSGTLTVSNGGVVTSGTRVSSTAQIGVSDSVGAVDVSSATANASVWNHRGSLFVGSTGSDGGTGTGTLNVGPGGAVGVTGTLNLYGSTSSALGQSGGTVNLSGGTLSVGTLATYGAPARVVWTGGTLQITGSNVTVGTAGTIASQTFGPGKSLVVTGDTALAGGGAITLSGGSVTTGTLSGVTPANLTFNSGTLTIAAGNLSVGTNGALGATPALAAGSTLDVAQTTTITAGSSLTVAGGTFRTGTANVLGALAVTSGTVQVGTAGQSPALSGAGGIDLRGGVLRVAYSGTSPLTAVRTMLAAGYAQGTPFALGQIRSTTATAARGLGYRDDGTAVTVMATLYGDANLDGQVDFNDFIALQTHYLVVGTGFDQGNFDYDNVTDFNDFIAIQTNFGQNVNGLSVAVTAEQVAALNAFAAANEVPEPGVAVAALAGAAVLRRRRVNTANPAS